MTSQTDTIKNIPDQKPVRIFLPILDKDERYRLNGIFEATEPPKFNLLFPAGMLPVDFIDTKPSCIITVDMGGPAISLEARILKIDDSGQKLEMVAEKSISHEQLRDFFRVDTATSVISSSFQPEFFSNQGEPWSLEGRTIDISGSGILASFVHPPPMDRQVRLEVTLPSSFREKITLLAHPVRSQQVGKNQFEVAYQFDDISPEDRDKIIGCCLVIQRQMLRLKVQVKKPS